MRERNVFYSWSGRLTANNLLPRTLLFLRVSAAVALLKEGSFDLASEPWLCFSTTDCFLAECMCVFCPASWPNRGLTNELYWHERPTTTIVCPLDLCYVLMDSTFEPLSWENNSVILQSFISKSEYTHFHWQGLNNLHIIDMTGATSVWYSIQTFF